MAKEITQVPIADSEVDPLVGTIVGSRYQVLELLGKGGMGAVYRAKQIYTKRNVALKILLPGTPLNVARSIRFQREAQAASALTHPDIVTIFDFGIADDFQAFLIMDFVPGRSLEEEIEEHGPLSIDRFVRIFARACDAFAHAHKQGIIHRDIKDTNIMLFDNEEGQDNIKIVDFGLARILEDDDDPNMSLTETGNTVGTPTYMSPEQCRGLKCDARSDIYSLGCVMYKALTGQPPFKAQARVDVMHKHLREFAPAMGLIVPGRGITQPLERMVAKCLAKEPEYRYQSMPELKHDLLNLPFGTTVKPRGPASVEEAPALSAEGAAPAAASVSSGSAVGGAPSAVSTVETVAAGSSSRERVKTVSYENKAASRERTLAYWSVSVAIIMFALIIGFSVITRSIHGRSNVAGSSQKVGNPSSENASSATTAPVEPTGSSTTAGAEDAPVEYSSGGQPEAEPSVRGDPANSLEKPSATPSDIETDQTAPAENINLGDKAAQSALLKQMADPKFAAPLQGSVDRAGGMFDKDWPPDWSQIERNKDIEKDVTDRVERSLSRTGEFPEGIQPGRSLPNLDPSQFPYPPPQGMPFLPPGAPLPPPGAPFPPPPGAP